MEYTENSNNGMLYIRNSHTAVMCSEENSQTKLLTCINKKPSLFFFKSRNLRPIYEIKPLTHQNKEEKN